MATWEVMLETDGGAVTVETLRLLDGGMGDYDVLCWIFIVGYLLWH